MSYLHISLILVLFNHYSTISLKPLERQHGYIDDEIIKIVHENIFTLLREFFIRNNIITAF